MKTFKGKYRHLIFKSFKVKFRFFFLSNKSKEFHPMLNTSQFNKPDFYTPAGITFSTTVVQKPTNPSATSEYPKEPHFQGGENLWVCEPHTHMHKHKTHAKGAQQRGPLPTKLNFCWHFQICPGMLCLAISNCIELTGGVLSFPLLYSVPNIYFQHSIQSYLVVLLAVFLKILYLQRMQCIRASRDNVSTSRDNVGYSCELSRDTSWLIWNYFISIKDNILLFWQFLKRKRCF